MALNENNVFIQKEAAKLLKDSKGTFNLEKLSYYLTKKRNAVLYSKSHPNNKRRAIKLATLSAKWQADAAEEAQEKVQEKIDLIIRQAVSDESKIWRDFCSAIVKRANEAKNEFEKKKHENDWAEDLESLFEEEE